MLREEEYIAIGKYLAYILRHHPEAAGLTMNKHGWVKVDALLKALNDNFDFNIQEKDLKYAVNHDSKTRFALSEDFMLIRANQGHSISVDVELIERTPPAVLWHGTATRFCSSIEEKGILSQTRLYVHLSADQDTAYEVGARHGNPHVYKIDAGKMHNDGYRFFVSVNGVWLTKYVPVKYLVNLAKE